MEREIEFVVVYNKGDESIVTCPKTSLKEETYLFNNPKVVMSFVCYEGTDYQSKEFAYTIHQTYVKSTESGKEKLIKETNKKKFNTEKVLL